MCSCQQPGAHHFCRTGTQQCCAGGLQHAWADRAKQALMAWEGSEMTDHLGHPSAEGESSSLCLSSPERSRGDMITLFQGHSGASLGARGHIPSNGQQKVWWVSWFRHRVLLPPHLPGPQSLAFCASPFAILAAWKASIILPHCSSPGGLKQRSMTPPAQQPAVTPKQ